MPTKMKKIVTIIFVLSLIAITWCFFAYYRAFHSPLLTGNKKQSVIVAPGSTISDLAHELQSKKLLAHTDLFIFFARLNGSAVKLRYGEYLIKPGMSAAELLNNIIHAKGMVVRSVRFIEGWTFEQIKIELAENKNLKHLIENKTNKEIMTMLGHPNQSPEGMFFPDTYHFTWGHSDLDILKTAYQKMQQVLENFWKTRANDLPYKSPYQGLIVASLVEKETALNYERPKIAGVILRRLEKRMRLQVDPTVLYGLGKPYGSVITRKDLLSNTPYNTYKIYGLPPTPIDMPSLASIQAAFHPILGNALYYVSRGDGSHQFSATYREHLAAIAKYREIRANDLKRDFESQHHIPSWRNFWHKWFFDTFYYSFILLESYV